MSLVTIQWAWFFCFKSEHFEEKITQPLPFLEENSRNLYHFFEDFSIFQVNKSKFLIQTVQNLYKKTIEEGEARGQLQIQGLSPQRGQSRGQDFEQRLSFHPTTGQLRWETWLSLFMKPCTQEMILWLHPCPHQGHRGCRMGWTITGIRATTPCTLLQVRLK